LLDLRSVLEEVQVASRYFKLVAFAPKDSAPVLALIDVKDLFTASITVKANDLQASSTLHYDRAGPRSANEGFPLFPWLRGRGIELFPLLRARGIELILLPRARRRTN
jgi:hypothetical protein